MGYLIFSTRQEAIDIEAKIVSNMLNESNKNRVQSGGLLSVTTTGIIDLSAIKTTKWADVIELTDNRFAIIAPHKELMNGIDIKISELNQTDFPQIESPFL